MLSATQIPAHITSIDLPLHELLELFPNLVAVADRGEVVWTREHPREGTEPEH